MTVPVGYVAVRTFPNGRQHERITLHLMRELPSRNTLCGLWTRDDILPEETDCYDARTCGRCKQAVTGGKR